MTENLTTPDPREKNLPKWAQESLNRMRHHLEGGLRSAIAERDDARALLDPEPVENPGPGVYLTDLDGRLVPVPKTFAHEVVLRSLDGSEVRARLHNRSHDGTKDAGVEVNLRQHGAAPGPLQVRVQSLVSSVTLRPEDHYTVVVESQARC